jgi:hypothetical protein
MPTYVGVVPENVNAAIKWQIPLARERKVTQLFISDHSQGGAEPGQSRP